MKTNLMMTTVSALALSSAGAGAATVDEPANADPGKYTLSFEGGIGRLDSAPSDKWGNGSGGIPADKFGSGEDLSYTGALSLTRSLGENRDVRLGLSLGGTPSNDRLYSSAFSSGFSSGHFDNNSGDYSSALSNKFSFGAIDVDTGLTHHTKAGDVRVFSGLRGMVTHSSSELNSDQIGQSGGMPAQLSASLNERSKFVGVGPHVGVGFSSKHSGKGFGVSAELGVAALFGQRSDDNLATVTYSHGSGFNGAAFTSSFSSGYSVKKATTVLNLDGKVSLDYHFSDAAQVSLGYQARQLWNVDAFSDKTNSAGNPRLMDGLFLGFTTTF